MAWPVPTLLSSTVTCAQLCPWSAYLAPVQYVLHRCSRRTVCCIHIHSRLKDEHDELENENSGKVIFINTILFFKGQNIEICT